MGNCCCKCCRRKVKEKPEHDKKEQNFASISKTPDQKHVESGNFEDANSEKLDNASKYLQQVPSQNKSDLNEEENVQPTSDFELPCGPNQSEIPTRNDKPEIVEEFAQTNSEKSPTQRQFVEDSDDNASSESVYENAVDLESSPTEKHETELDSKDISLLVGKNKQNDDLDSQNQQIDAEIPDKSDYQAEPNNNGQINEPKTFKSEATIYPKNNNSKVVLPKIDVLPSESISKGIFVGEQQTTTENENDSNQTETIINEPKCNGHRKNMYIDDNVAQHDSFNNKPEINTYQIQNSHPEKDVSKNEIENKTAPENLNVNNVETYDSMPEALPEQPYHTIEYADVTDIAIQMSPEVSSDSDSCDSDDESPESSPVQRSSFCDPPINGGNLQMKFVTKGLQIPVYVQTPVEEQIKHDRLLKEYVNALEEIKDWLDCKEKKVDEILALPVPLEPNALHEQVKLVDELLHEIEEGKKLLDTFNAASENLQTCPKFVYQHLEEKSTLPETQTEITDRYDALSAKSSSLSSKLHGTLEQSEDVSDQLENLQKLLKMIGEKISDSKNNATATSESVAKNMEILEDLNKQTDDIGGKVEDLQKKCVNLFGSANSEAGCSLKSTMANLVTLQASVNHEGQHFHKHLSEVEDDLRNFEKSCDDVTGVLDDASERTAGLGDEDECDGKSGDDLQEKIEATEENIKKLQEIRSEVLAKEPEYTNAVSVGEKLLVNCCFDTKPLASSIEDLKSKWKNAFGEIKSCEDDLVGSGKELARNQDAMCKVKEWVEQCGGDLAAMKDSVQQKVVSSDLETIKDHMEKAEPIRNDALCEKYLHVPFCISPSSDKTNTDDCICFTDLLEKSKSKQKDLQKIVEDLSDISSKSAAFCEVLDLEEQAKESWEKKFADVNLETLKADAESYKAWRDGVKLHAPDFESLQNTVKSFKKQNGKAEGMDEVVDAYENIESRWKKLLADCDDLGHQVSCKCDAQSRYLEKQDRLGEWLQDKRTIFSMLDVPCADPEAFEKQNKQIEKLSKDVASHEHNLDEAASLVEVLPQLSPMYEQLKEDWEKLKEDLQQLLSKRMNSNDKLKLMNDLLDDLSAWSKDVKDKIEETKLEADVEKFQDELDKIKKQRDDEVKENKGKLSDCANHAKDLAASGLISDNLQCDVTNKATNAFESAMKAIDNHENKVKEMLKDLESSIESCKDIVAWCKATSLELKSMDKSPSTLNQLDASLQRLEDYSDTGEKHLDNLEKTEECLRKLSEKCESGDQQFVKDAKEALDAVLDEIKNTKLTLKERRDDLEKFNELNAACDQKLESIKNRINLIQEMSGLTSKQIKYCQDVNADLADEGHAVVGVCDFAKRLTAATSPRLLSPATASGTCQLATADDEHLTVAANALAEKYQELKQALADLAANLDSVAKFEAEISDICDKLNLLETGFDEFDPVSRSEPTLLDQQRESTQLLDSFVALEQDATDLDRRYQEYAATAPDGASHERDIKTVARNARRLVEKCRKREAEVGDTLEQVRSFDVTSDELESDLVRMIGEMKAKDCKAANAERLKELQDELKEFRQECIYPARRRTNESTTSGYALIYSAHHSVPTHHILEKVKKIEHLWAQLSEQVEVTAPLQALVKEEVASFDSELQNALISSGHYKDVYDSYLIWLRNVELLVARQQPLSWEYTVVAVQLEEHKALEEILHKEHEVLQTFLRQFSDYHSSPEDQNNIQDLKRRWEDVSDKVSKRSDELSAVTSEARLFHGLSTKFQVWLGKVEKRSMDLVFTGTLQDRITKEIQHQQALLKEISQHEGEMGEIESTPLRKLFTDNEEQSESLNNHLVVLRSRYEEAKRLVEGRHGVLLANQELAHIFNERLLSLFAFVVECKLRLSKWEDQEGNVRVLDAKPAHIKKASEACEAILDEVKRKQPMLETSVKQGRGLLSQCAGDDNLQAHEKLDNLSVEFNLLITRSTSIASKLASSMDDSDRLDDADRKLKSWFKDSNKLFYDLELKEEMDLEKWNEQAKSFELHEHEGLLDTVKQTAGNLQAISMWWGPQLLSKLWKLHKTQFAVVKDKFDALNKNYAEIQEQMEQFNDELNTGEELVDKFVDAIDRYEDISALDEETLKDKKQQQKEMDDLRSEVGAHSVKLEQTFHKLVCRVDRDTAKPLKASMDAYRSKMQDALKKQEHCLASSALALSLASKWHETNKSLLSWMEEANNELEAIKGEKCSKLETYKQKLQALLHKHAEERPLAENIVKLSSQIGKLLDPSSAAEELQATSVKNQDEYFEFGKKLEDLIKDVDEHGKELLELMQHLDEESKYASDLMEDLTHLPPVSLDEEPLLQRACVFEKLLSPGGEFTERLPSHQDEVDQIVQDLSDLGYEHLQQGVADKFVSLEELKSSLQDFSTDELEKLKALLDAIRNFSAKGEETTEKLSALSDSIESLSVPQVINPDILSQKTTEFETLTGDLLEAGEEVTCLTTLGEECKLSKVTSGVEPSSVDSSVQEATRELAKVQDLFEKKKMDFNYALEYAIHFHKTAAALKRKFAEQCAKIDRLPDDLNDVDAIKDEIEQLKAIRAESTPHQIEGKNLCAQAYDVIARSGVAVESQGEEVEQLQNASKLLDDKLQEKQVSLDNSLIDAGEMQHATDELKDWMDETADKLAAQQESCEFCVNDSKKLELELTKLKVTSQDIAAHEPTYKSIAAATRDSDDLTRQWDGINATSAELKKTLEQYLESAQSKEAELFDIEGWIDDQQNFLNNSTFFGGLPETAQQQLDNHVAFMDELENKRNAMEKILEGPNMDGKDLREKMEKLKAQADTRKAKLEEVLAEAKAFHERLEKFVSWLGQAEKTLSAFQETKHSILYPAIKETLDEQKSFEEGVVAMRPEILELDKNGSRLKYFSQKQDGILIKNLLLSVHARWDKLVSATSARSANITDVHKKSKQFHDDYEKLRDWIATVHKQLESGQSDFYVDAPDSVENELDNFKEFQRALAAKQPVYEGVQRSGLLLCEKVLQQNDKHDVEAKLKQLKKEWNGVNQQSVKRKHQLEESLLVSGRFIEAIESLLQWLCKIEPGVESQENLNGDIHTVNALIDRHNILHNEFNARAANVESLQASVDGQGDSWVSHQLKELLERWNDVSDKISTKADKLEDALLKAKELHSSAQVVLDELSSIEKHLQSQPKFPDDEFQLEELKAAHQTVTNDLDATLERRDKVISLASEILKSSHPDAHTPLRQLITVLDTKCDEVKQMSDEYGANLDEALDKLKRDSDRLKKLENWLEEGEDNLRRKEAININEENIQRLKEEQEMFQEEMISHQPDYESLMNLYKRKHSPTKRKGDLKKSPRAGDSEGSPMESLCDNVHATWQRVWLMSLQHERKLQAAEESIRRNGQQDDFDFDDWRTRYMKYLKHKRARVMDFFRELDKDGSGQISRELFVNEILKSKFQTNEAEMSRVADVFDQDGDGFIDYYEFIAALYPSRDAYKPESDADKIDDEVVRQVSKCTCCKKFRVEQIAENKYKFGDNQQLRLVRILRSTVMVRVGGGWMALDEFLIKNDPCRAKGRTNTELREKFILPSGSSQAMTPFKTKRATRSPQKPSPTSSVASDLSSTTSDCSSLRHHHKMSHTSPAKLPSRNSTPVPPHSKRGETTPKRTSTPTHPTGAGRETPKRTPTPNRPNTTPGRTSKIPTKDRTPKR